MALRHLLNAKLDGLFTFQILCTIFCFSCALRRDKHRHFLHNNDFEARSTLRPSPELCEKMTRIFTWEIFSATFLRYSSASLENVLD